MDKTLFVRRQRRREKITTQRRWRRQNLHIGKVALERFEVRSDMDAVW